MVDELDLVRQVHDLDPVPAGSTPHEAIRTRVLNEILSAKSNSQQRSSTSGARRRKGRRRLLALVAVPAAGALAAAGWALASRQANQVTESIGCYSAPSLHANINIVASTGASPVGVCAGQWQAGTVAGPVTVIPRLTACVLPRGNAIGVFPDTTCDRLGLQALPAGYASAAKTYSAMTGQLVAELGQSGNTTCVTQTRAVTLVKEALRNYGYRGWTVSADGFTPVTPCAVFDPDPDHHHITVSGQQTPQFAQAINAAVEAQRDTCAPGDPPQSAAAALGLFRSHLRAAGFGNWTVVVDPGVTTTPAQPCYDPAPDAATRTVHLNATMAMSRSS